MILPALRGYYTSLVDRLPTRQGNAIRIGCQRCKCERVLYHKENCGNRQTRFPAFCLKCGSMIVVEIRKVKGKRKEVMRPMAPKKKGKKRGKPAPGGVAGGK